MLAPLKEEFGKVGFEYRTLYDFFVWRVQQYLHVALCMDNANEGFLLRCESNPALYTRCSMLWMGSWSQRSMEALAHTAMADLDDELLPPAQRHKHFHSAACCRRLVLAYLFQAKNE